MSNSFEMNTNEPYSNHDLELWRSAQYQHFPGPANHQDVFGMSPYEQPSNGDLESQYRHLSGLPNQYNAMSANAFEPYSFERPSEENLATWRSAQDRFHPHQSNQNSAFSSYDPALNTHDQSLKNNLDPTNPVQYRLFGNMLGGLSPLGGVLGSASFLSNIIGKAFEIGHMLGIVPGCRNQGLLDSNPVGSLLKGAKVGASFLDSMAGGSFLKGSKLGGSFLLGRSIRAPSYLGMMSEGQNSAGYVAYVGKEGIMPGGQVPNDLKRPWYHTINENIYNYPNPHYHNFYERRRNYNSFEPLPVSNDDPEMLSHTQRSPSYHYRMMPSWRNPNQRLIKIIISFLRDALLNKVHPQSNMYPEENKKSNSSAASGLHHDPVQGRNSVPYNNSKENMHHQNFSNDTAFQEIVTSEHHHDSVQGRNSVPHNNSEENMHHLNFSNDTAFQESVTSELHHDLVQEQNSIPSKNSNEITHYPDSSNYMDFQNSVTSEVPQDQVDEHKSTPSNEFGLSSYQQTQNQEAINPGLNLQNLDQVDEHKSTPFNEFGFRSYQQTQNQEAINPGLNLQNLDQVNEHASTSSNEFGQSSYQQTQNKYQVSINPGVNQQNLDQAFTPPDICLNEQAVGSCAASFQRYYYNLSSRQCEKFIYGGCEGNANNFLLKEECESFCLGKKGNPLKNSAFDVEKLIQHV